MKILLVNDYGGATGGAEIQMLTLRRLLRDRGHDARLFASNAQMVSRSPNLADYSCYGTTNQVQVLSQTFNVSAYVRLRQVLSAFQPDVVHVRMFLWQLSPLILPLIKSYPSLYQTAVYKAICPIGTNILPSGEPCRFAPGGACLKQGCVTPQSWISLMTQQRLWRRWKNSFDRIVALSHGMKRELAQAGIHDVEVVYNGVPERSARPTLTSAPTVGYAGRFSAEKGIETLFRAFAKVAQQVPDARLMMAGRGPTEVALKTLAKKLAIADQITWLGHVSRAEMERQLETLWVQVVPSLWAEPFGNVTTEAMMRATAVVVSSVGAQPEIVGERAGGANPVGALVLPGNVEALAEALLPILRSRTVAEQMGNAGRERALAHFSETKCVESFLHIYSELVGQSFDNHLSHSVATAPSASS